MKLELRPPGLIGLFSMQKAKEGKRAADVDPEEYEVTKFGRKPKGRGRRGMMLTMLGAGAGVAAVAGAVWMLL